MSFDSDNRREILATIAARGILAHNSAVELPKAFSFNQIYDMLNDVHEDNLWRWLDELTKAGYLYKYDTGHADYGNTYTEGQDVWKITSKGLIALWNERD